MTKTVRFREGDRHEGQVWEVEDGTRFMHDGYNQFGLIVDPISQTDRLAVPVAELERGSADT